jgi:hypothetical protein
MLLSDMERKTDYSAFSAVQQYEPAVSVPQPPSESPTPPRADASPCNQMQHHLPDRDDVAPGVRPGTPLPAKSPLQSADVGMQPHAT